MPTMYNITLKQGKDENVLKQAKQTAREKGGTIRHEYTLIKGFTVEFPNETVHTLESNEHIHVEQDGEARTQ